MKISRWKNRARSLFAFITLLAVPVACWGAEGEEDAFFEKEIRPLLIAHCQQCHGDTKEPKGQLSLTSREAVLRGGESGPAAVPGKPADSLLIAAINYHGPEMPPDGKRLSEIEIARLTRWVELGLPWPAADPATLRAAQHRAESIQIDAARRTWWSFQPVREPPLPEVRQADWPRMPIDRFLLAQLELRGLSPSAGADKRTLLRRLTFDLTGLPPTAAEIDAFLADTSNEATSRVVERLLASPHYGERWARHWLDVARYADTRGYVLFQSPDFPWSYTYRDYVVQSLNDDLPYDRFLLEQLAADRLPLGADRGPLRALGFLTLGNGFMSNQHDVIDDRMDVITRGLMGLTVTCARCHDHKFDPIPTRDYYSLYGILASAREPATPPLFADPPRTEAYETFARELAERERKLNDFLNQKYNALIQGARSRVGEYLLAAQGMIDKPPIEDFMLLADGADLNPTMLVRYQVYLQQSRARHDPVLAPWHALAALPGDKFAEQSGPTLLQLQSTNTPERPVNPLVLGALLGQPLKEMADVAKVYATLLGHVDAAWQASVSQAASAATAAPQALPDAAIEAVRQLLYGRDAPAMLAREQINELALLPDRPAQAERTALVKAVEEWRSTGPGAPPRAMAVEDLPTPIVPRVFVRGNPNQLGDEVPRRFLQVLSAGQPPSLAGSGRLELAHAVVDRGNPLTARVLVNRVWMHHFGTGLVSTPSDFGMRSQPPSHPQLLDYLAWNFMEHGWSLKWLHRQIVLSAAYAQVSDDRADCQRADPENILLWKMNRRRLDLETMRDALLTVSGRLDPQLGGPPIRGAFEPAATRRTVYGYIDRLNLPGLMRTFDFPSPDSSASQRSQTTVPQQALFFMNHPLVQECAKQLLNRAEISAAPDRPAKVRAMFRCLLGRDPDADELGWSETFLGTAPRADKEWFEYAQALLVSNEFMFVD